MIINKFLYIMFMIGRSLAEGSTSEEEQRPAATLPAPG